MNLFPELIGKTQLPVQQVPVNQEVPTDQEESLSNQLLNQPPRNFSQIKIFTTITIMFFILLIKNNPLSIYNL